MKSWKIWKIENTKSGLILGTYPGATQAEALEALARDAGYRTYAEMQEVAPAAEGELRLVEVDPIDGWHNLRAGGSALFDDGTAVRVSNRPCDGEGHFDAAFPRMNPLWERSVFCELCARTGRAYRWAEGSSWDAAEGEDEAVREVEQDW